MRIVPVDGEGLVDLEALAATLNERTALVSVMAANNETGAVQPISEIGEICTDARIPLHVDAAQAAGRIPIETAARHAALISVSGHKMHGPMGLERSSSVACAHEPA